MNIKFSLFVLTLLITSVFNAYAYEVDTHQILTQEAVKNSDAFSNISYFANMGVSVDISAAISQFSNGAFDEDKRSYTRPLNHFFNPHGSAGDQALKININLPFNGEKLILGENNGLYTNYNSPDWALEDTKNIPEQSFSWQDARKNFYSALTDAHPSDRANYINNTFYALGHVVHHVQDMAQPQHVRNDPHDPFTSGDCTVSTLCGLVDLTDNRPQGGYIHASLYESFTNAILSSLPLTGYPAVYTKNQTNGFTQPRDFWTRVDGKGMADYSNSNFISAGTNFNYQYSFPPLDLFFPPFFFDYFFSFSSPVANNETQVTVDTLCNSNYTINPFDVTSCSPLLSLFKGYFVSVIGNTVIDKLESDPPLLNPYASTKSMFDADLSLAGFSEIYTENRFNFKSKLNFVIPRAIGYSTGLINFFFRGSINMMANSDGTYNIINQNSEVLTGTFELWYDAVDNTRKLAQSWLGNIAPSASLSIAKFDLPIDKDPAIPGYLLVFKGTMGNEVPKSGPGAIVAKMVNLENVVIGSCTIGSKGPAGGIIFYVNHGSTDSSCHGLEAAPVDQTPSNWGCWSWTGSQYTWTYLGGTGYAIGTGAANTAKIIAICGTSGGAGIPHSGTVTNAAATAAAYTLNGYSDWYLPSRDELNQLKRNQGDVGGFNNATHLYWSSTEDGSDGAWSQLFLETPVQYSDYKSNKHGVRAVRAF